jgi:hypothetical protein
MKDIAMTKIVRLTRHEASEAQIGELTRIFGADAEIAQVAVKLEGHQQTQIAQFDSAVGEADVVEAVLPLATLDAILKFSQFSKRGGLLVRANIVRTLLPGGGVEFVFDSYDAIRRIEIVTERL